MDVILAGHAMWGVVDSLPAHVHVVDVDPEPWTPFEPGWEDVPDTDGPLIPESYPDARNAELSNAELLCDAAYAALSAQLAGTVTGPSLLTDAGQDALNAAFDLAELADTGFERRAAELAAHRARYADADRFDVFDTVSEVAA